MWSLFKATLLVSSVLLVDGTQCNEPAVREDCQGDQNSCEQQGCCWAPVNPNPNNEPWCFKPSGGPSPPQPPKPPTPAKGSTTVSVMLALDSVTNDGKLADRGGLENQLRQLKSAGVDGVMSDVWWGITEPSPKKYNFEAYKEMVALVKQVGLKLQMVSSFHACGGGVGDKCNIPIPAFVRQNQDLFYKDQDGNIDEDYISLFADHTKVASAGDRTPLEMYEDWFEALNEAFAGDLGETIDEVQVGAGPAGELRYPAYQLKHWHFCGVGAFQSYDKYARESLANASKTQDKPASYGNPPNNAGDYNSQPGQTQFFQDNQANNYASEYGKFFLGWYSGELVKHASNVVGLARKTLPKLRLAMKIAGIHWWYKSSHHAAELTAGYHNSAGNDGYKAILDGLSGVENLRVDFTCLEMKDSEQSSQCASGPQELVNQVMNTALSHGREFAGENALPRYDDTAYNTIQSYKAHLSSFTYLRLGQTLLSGDNFGKFRNFVSNLHSSMMLGTMVV